MVDPSPPRLSEEARRLRGLVLRHERWRARETINLLPSENFASPQVLRYLGTDLARRYTLPLDQILHGERVDNGYAGTRYADAIEDLASRTTARLLKGTHASVRPLSGHVAAMSVLATLLPRGSRYLAVQPADGGYDGYAPGFLPAVLGHQVLPLPLHGPTHRADPEEVANILRRDRPEAMVLGQSFVLFPYPLRPLVEAAHEVGALVLYDASHVLGLVMGGVFQAPLEDGVDVVFGSTHKSLFGPQGGLLATRREDLFRQIDDALIWRVLDNTHLNRIAGLAQALLEMERWGSEYAPQVVRNTQRLARALHERGFSMVGAEEGFTASHQAFFDAEELRARTGLGPAGLARRLENDGLILDLVGRVGAAEATRLGMKEPEMETLADLIQRSARGEPVIREVRTMRKRFRVPHYC
jgi:glycine hydroxymethyltransferase